MNSNQIEAGPQMSCGYADSMEQIFYSFDADQVNLLADHIDSGCPFCRFKYNSPLAPGRALLRDEISAYYKLVKDEQNKNWFFKGLKNFTCAVIAGNAIAYGIYRATDK